MNVPTEIIRKIFLELCPPQKQTKFPLKPNQIRVSLTHVSSRWRAVALATPELWANIFIQIDNWHSRPNLPRLLDLVNIWISRSGHSTLSFDAEADDHSFFSSVFDLILPHTHRCSFLRLFGLDGAAIRRLLSLPPSSLFSLKKIIIVGGDSQPYVTSPSKDPPITVFQPCPQLRHAILFCGRGIDVTHFNLPWHQLTNLAFSTFSASPDTLLGALSKCISLVHCEIRISDISPLTLQSILPLSHDPAVLPFLQSLSLLNFSSSSDIHDGGNWDSHFLAALRCPTLREFTFTSSNPISLSLPFLQLFYKSCSETLESLDLIGSPYNYLPETLRLLPRLITLFADGSSLLPHEAQQLGGGTLTPRLTELTLRGVEIGEFLDVAEARVKAARADPNIASFTQMSLFDARGDQSEYTARLTALRGIGVNIGINANWE
ncbi:hypothetical protein BD779DRAFT_1549320 [Infundibulicybe gibba]|nr:hypothetical protein BD779DRAFT_1549320 [Infundibulicybe gibba]